MRYILLALVFFNMTAISALGDEDPCANAEAFFKQGLFNKGVFVLKKAYRQETISTEQRGRVMQKLARFYGELVGNVDEALRYQRKILKLALPPSHPLKVAARQNITRINTDAIKFRRENAILRRVRVEARRSEEVEKRIAELRALIARRPDFPSLATAYYYLGSHLLILKRYGEANDAFQRALELRPAMDFYRPVGERKRIAHSSWLRDTSSTIAWAVLGLVLLAMAVMFYLSRPWRWLSVRHLIVMAAMMGLWWATFTIITKWAGQHIPKPEFGFAQPTFISATSGNPGSEILGRLFRYGLVGVLGTFVFALGTARLKFRWARFTVNTTAAAVLFASLMTIFYLRHCDREGIFQPGKGSVVSHLLGTVYLEVRDMEPYVLTNPRAYPDLALDNMDDPVMQNWFEQQYARIAVLDSHDGDSRTVTKKNP